LALCEAAVSGIATNQKSGSVPMMNRISQQSGEQPTLRSFLHHLHDTIILLGGDIAFANLVKNPDMIDESAVNELRQYNGKLVDATKDKLAGINKLTISTRRG
jgi:hypothetical protein